MEVRIVIWYDQQDPKNQGWACHLARDNGDGYGFESDFSDPVDADPEASLQELIDEALRAVRNVPADAMDAKNWRDGPDGYEFRGTL